MMGCLVKEMFVQKEYLNQLGCTIGLGIFNDPVALPCQHVYCKNCIEEWLKRNGTCPRCRERYTVDQLKPQWIFAAIIKRAHVLCKNSCGWTGPYEMMDRHVLVECPKTDIPCPLGCAETITRGSYAEHKNSCANKIVECKSCKGKIKKSDLEDHMNSCSSNLLSCPRVCGAMLTPSELKAHLKEECKNSPLRCKYGKLAGCEFSGTRKELEEHYAGQQQEHLMLLVRTVAILQEKIAGLARPQRGMPANLGPLVTPNPDNPKFLQGVIWSTGSNVACGTVDKGWSVVLTAKPIFTPFRAKLKIAKVNLDDGNSWKMCVGLFNSAQFQAGSWGKFSNAWGYIMGSGQKASKGAETYGAPYASGDIIGIEYRGKSITFYKNQISQGEAFQNVMGPMYLGVALSDRGHFLEILSVEDLS